MVLGKTVQSTVSINVVKRLKPAHLLMIRLFWAGHTYVEIADKTGYTSQQVMNVLHSEESQEILSQLQGNALDTADEVQSELALVAPAVLDKKIRLALSSPDDRVANSACTDLLHMAGHSPVKRVTIDRANENQKKYEGLSEEQLREKLLESFGQGGVVGRDTGPDGNPLQ
jgi:predicted transcriptional regulator